MQPAPGPVCVFAKLHQRGGTATAARGQRYDTNKDHRASGPDRHALLADVLLQLATDLKHDVVWRHRRRREIRRRQAGGRRRGGGGERLQPDAIVSSKEAFACHAPRRALAPLEPSILLEDAQAEVTPTLPAALDDALHLGVHAAACVEDVHAIAATNVIIPVVVFKRRTRVRAA
eukprot:scaffold172049_cov31-Tisochrysis_lutea.AAC.2